MTDPNTVCLKVGDSAWVIDETGKPVRCRIVTHRARSLLILRDGTAWKQKAGGTACGFPGTDLADCYLEKQK